MIVDCFTFYNELDVLEWRLSILEDVVDRFVLCEATQTFRGVPKPLVFAEHRERFARWNDRLVHLVYDAAPDPNPWTNESGQRAYLTRALADCAPGDVVMMGDVDEIPAPENVARRPAPGRIVAHLQRLSLCYVNAFRDEPWIGTKAIAVGDLGDRSLDDLRQAGLDQCDPVHGGWHFTSLGGPEVLVRKYHVYSHLELAIPYNSDVEAIASAFVSESVYRWHPLDTVPPLLRDPRWSRYVWERPPDDVDAAAMMHAHGCFASVPAGARRVAVATAADAGAWERAGAARYAARFAGTHARLDDAVAELGSGDVAIVDGLERIAVDELQRAAERGVGLVAFARNARSAATLHPILSGGSYPPGPLLGERELRALIAAAGYAVVRRDALRRARFNATVLDLPEPIRTDVGPFGFEAATAAALEDFDTDAYIFTLRPARSQSARVGERDEAFGSADLEA